MFSRLRMPPAAIRGISFSMPADRSAATLPARLLADTPTPMPPCTMGSKVRPFKTNGLNPLCSNRSAMTGSMCGRLRARVMGQQSCVWHALLTWGCTSGTPWRAAGTDCSAAIGDVPCDRSNRRLGVTCFATNARRVRCDRRRVRPRGCTRRPGGGDRASSRETRSSVRHAPSGLQDSRRWQSRLEQCQAGPPHAGVQYGGGVLGMALESS